MLSNSVSQKPTPGVGGCFASGRRHLGLTTLVYVHGSAKHGFLLLAALEHDEHEQHKNGRGATFQKRKSSFMQPLLWPAQLASGSLSNSGPYTDDIDVYPPCFSFLISWRMSTVGELDSYMGDCCIYCIKRGKVREYTLMFSPSQRQTLSPHPRFSSPPSPAA